MKNKEKGITTQAEYKKERNYQVIKSNDLIQNSRFELSMLEQRIILYLITKIKPEDTEFHEYEFNINNFCEVCGIEKNNGGNIEALKTTIMNLANKSNWVKIVKDGEEYETLLRWIDKVRIHTKKGTIKIRLDNDMKPYLLELRNRFTAYNYYYILAMKSKYSIRLYELLKSYEYIGQHTFEIEKLKRMLSAEKYASYKDFRVKVLDIAVREINEFSDITVMYCAEKNGRKYETIKFKIIPKTDTLERVRTYKKIEQQLNN
jgi:plasmid replication initiation protein